ncbi:hypothetical protein [Xenorhabdus mauleonii]|nr:hypothetical protein [Xenorhabdus mauleonii]
MTNSSGTNLNSQSLASGDRGDRALPTKRQFERRSAYGFEL